MENINLEWNNKNIFLAISFQPDEGFQHPLLAALPNNNCADLHFKSLQISRLSNVSSVNDVEHILNLALERLFTFMNAIRKLQ